MNEQLKSGWNRVVTAWEQNPIEVTICGAIALGAVAKIINALSAAQGRHAYAKQVKYMVKRRRYPKGS